MLSKYLFDTTQLLRDSNYQFNSKPVLTRYINQARTQVATQTGCIRALIAGQAPFGNSSVPGTMTPGAAYPSTPLIQNFTTLVGVEKYAYGFANPFLKATTQGVKGIIDVIDVAVSWGGIRPSLNWIPWDDLQAYARSWNIGVFSYPMLWSTNGDGARGQVWLYPVPQMASTGGGIGAQGEMEWDVTCLPSPIYSDDDYEALPETFSDSVKYWAAALAFLGSQRFGMAAIMKELFNETLGISRSASDKGKTASFYDTDY